MILPRPSTAGLRSILRRSSLTIRDPGPGFDPYGATQSTEAGTHITPQGRGICLMRSLMDEVTYHRGGTELQLRKLRAATI